MEYIDKEIVSVETCLDEDDIKYNMVHYAVGHWKQLNYHKKIF